MSEPVTRFVVGPRESGKRLDQFLHERIPGLSRTRIQRAIRERVEVSWGVRARPSTPVRGGGVVNIGYTPLAETLLDISVEILIRENGWMAVNKPPTVPVHPVNKIRENSLIRILRRQEGEPDLRLTHRLDRETSGVLLVARDVAASRVLAGAFMRGEVHKEYLALVHGAIEGDEGRIDLPIGDAESSKIFTKRGVGTADQGQQASTRWRIERRWSDRTLLRLFPRTGRRHQLRVHLAAIGHPILGDLLYGRPEADYLRLVRGEGDARAQEDGPRRQLLHCARLVFPDPEGAGRREAVAPVPEDFQV